MPTLRGHITVSAAPGEVDVEVPCNAKATVCLPRSAGDRASLHSPRSTRLTVDGVEVAARAVGGQRRSSANVALVSSADCVELKWRACTEWRASASTWSVMSESSGATTTVSPLESSAGSWKQRLLPAPVGAM